MHPLSLIHIEMCIRDRVYRYLFSLCRDADLAEELCQETFCQSLRQLGSFRGDCTPQVWLCAIAKRLWYKELERRKRNVPLEEEHLAGQAAPDDPAQDVYKRQVPLLLAPDGRRLAKRDRDQELGALQQRFPARALVSCV